MAARQTSPRRVSLFSDGVFAVIITILVLKLKPPGSDNFSALLPLWPTGLSYLVSYLFIAIVWVNQHHLFSYAEVATPRLVWSNFAHLFSVSLIPFTTEWTADSRLPHRQWQCMQPYSSSLASPISRSVGKRSTDPRARTSRSVCADVANEIVHNDRPVRGSGTGRVRWPVVAMALICLCLIGYLRPDIPAPKNVVGNEH
ncbi:MAG TPA: TMEM175 family protein [Mycobacterium sp.]|nr:TMEM175 family protein [Mycobacterium sp.]